MPAIAIVLSVILIVVSPLATTVFGGEVVVIEDFEAGAPAAFPPHWQARGDQATANRIYQVTSENGERFLHAVAEANSIQIGLPVTLKLSEHPLLSWRWRAREIPAGADEREAATNDSAAGVYVVFKGSLGGFVPRAIKYVWSARLPPGTALPSPRYPNSRFVVLESGAASDGGWRTETVNVREDYRRFFKSEPGDPQGIAILTDADNTGTRSAADYDDFRALAAPAASNAAPASPAPPAP